MRRITGRMGRDEKKGRKETKSDIENLKNQFPENQS
jgi:hypothetical protein|tara:strand:+ start:16424 stop:16531 length:108 start_codon:yes stop_codon:yes gene_type:complete